MVLLAFEPATVHITTVSGACSSTVQVLYKRKPVQFLPPVNIEDEEAEVRHLSQDVATRSLGLAVALFLFGLTTRLSGLAHTSDW